MRVGIRMAILRGQEDDTYSFRGNHVDVCMEESYNDDDGQSCRKIVGQGS